MYQAKLSLIDTITLKDNTPELWCYTNIEQGVITMKWVNHLKVSDAIRAFLINLKDKNSLDQA